MERQLSIGAAVIGPWPNAIGKVVKITTEGVIVSWVSTNPGYTTYFIVLERADTLTVR